MQDVVAIAAIDRVVIIIAAQVAIVVRALQILDGAIGVARRVPGVLIGQDKIRGTAKLADLCAALWPVFTPPLTAKRRLPASRNSFDHL